MTMSPDAFHPDRQFWTFQRTSHSYQDFKRIKFVTAPNRGFGRFSRLVEHFEMCLKWQKNGFKWAKSAQYEANNDFSRALY